MTRASEATGDMDRASEATGEVAVTSEATEKAGTNGQAGTELLGSARDGDVLTLTLCRPDRRNAMNDELVDRLRDALERAVDEAVRAIVLTGTGTAFSAGADLAGLNSDDFIERLFGLMRTIESVPIPVIAAVNGLAIGGGTQLALAADLRVVAPQAYFQIPAVRIGISVDRWTMHRLAAMVGQSRARAMMLGAQRLTADEALHCGFAHRLGTLADAQEWAAEIAASCAPLALAHMKSVLNDDGTRDPETPEQVAARLRTWSSADAVEAFRARAELRTPKFTGH